MDDSIAKFLYTEVDNRAVYQFYFVSELHLCPTFSAHTTKEVKVNVSRLIGGIVCLLIAALLAVLYFVLPTDRMVFMVGEKNLSWLPPVILGIVGIILVASAMSSGTDRAVGAESGLQRDDNQTAELVAQNKRLESIGWGFFLVMLGGSLIIPDDVAPDGVWTIGVGLIMLGLNAARYFYRIRMSAFTTILGIIAVAVGIAELLGFDMLGGAFLLIILGAYLLLKPVFDRRQLFGKAEQS